MIAAGDRTAQQKLRANGDLTHWGRGNHFIEYETRGGFHTSFGRGDPCTQYLSQNGEDAILLSVLGGTGFSL